MAKRYTIDDMQEYATYYGGKCLSKEYINPSTALKWKCEEGHTWDADFQIIKQGGWCPACFKVQQNKGQKLETLQAIAKKRGGKCLSLDYTNNRTKIQFSCNEGHIWLMRPHDIKAGQWCPKCGIQRRVAKRRLSIEIFHKIAKQRGGKLLSDKYFNGHTKLLWQCSKGHQWQADGAMIIHAKSWCPYCRGRHKTIKDMQDLANKKNGKCLSKKYISSTTKLKWQCDKGHIWNSAPYNIIDNCWCPTCGYEIATEKQKDNIEKYRKIASKKGGLLLSDNYVNNRTPLLWQCKKGHRWNARPLNILHHKAWCPFCFDISRGRKLRQTSVQQTFV